MKELIAILIFLAGGIYSAHKLKMSEIIILVLLLLLVDYYFLFKRKTKKKNIDRFSDTKKLKKYLITLASMYRIVSLLLVFVYGFISCYLIDNHKNKLAEEKLYVSTEYEAVIIGMSETKDKYKLTARIKEFNENVEVYANKITYKEVYPGYKLKLKGILTKIEEPRNFGQYNEKQNKKERRIYYNFLGKVEEISEGKIFFATSIYKFKKALCEIYDLILDDESSGIIKAMVLGEKSFLEEDTKKIFKEGGVFHILAISGMHVSVIMSFIISLLKKMKVPIKKRPYFTISISVFYMILTGMSVSIVRATLMNVLSEIAIFLGREYNSTSGLCLAAIIILIFNPAMLFSLSFILSFSAILAIKSHLKFKGILKVQAVNISVFIIMLPILAYNFYSVQGLSIMANIFIVPLASLLLISSILVILFYYLNPNVSIIFGKLIAMILGYYESVLTYLSKLTGFNIVVGKISIFQIFVWYVGYLILYKFLKYDKYKLSEKVKKYRSIQLFIIAIVIYFLISIRYNDKVYVTFVDVGHGDASVIFDNKRESVIVIDGGGKNDNKNDTGKYNVYPYLMYEGINHIDLAVCTHTDRDHIKGILELVDLIEIKNVAVPLGNLNGSYYSELIKKCDQKNINILRLKEGDNVSIKSLNFDVLYPPEDIENLNMSDNNNSLTLKFDINEKVLIFTGDIEKEAEEIICENWIKEKEVFLMKVPHHGSDTSSTEKFVKLIDPEIAIISGDKSNIEKFNLKNKWKYMNSCVYTTYRCGMIKFEMKRGQ